MSPFLALYGRHPPTVRDYVPGRASSTGLDVLLQEKQELLRSLKQNLFRSKQRMKSYVDTKRTDRTFDSGSWVWLRLQPHRQHTVVRRPSQKLARRYFGPFKVLRRIGNVAYELALPPDSKVHNVFHVSLLRPYFGPSPPVNTVVLPTSSAPSALPAVAVSNEVGHLAPSVPHNEDGSVQFGKKCVVGKKSVVAFSHGRGNDVEAIELRECEVVEGETPNVTLSNGVTRIQEELNGEINEFTKFEGVSRLEKAPQIDDKVSQKSLNESELLQKKESPSRGSMDHFLRSPRGPTSVSPLIATRGSMSSIPCSARGPTPGPSYLPKDITQIPFSHATSPPLINSSCPPLTAKESLPVDSPKHSRQLARGFEKPVQNVELVPTVLDNTHQLISSPPGPLFSAGSGSVRPNLEVKVPSHGLGNVGLTEYHKPKRVTQPPKKLQDYIWKGI